MATGFDCPESGTCAGIAFEFPAVDSPSSSPPRKVPKRVRKRLLESKSPSSVEEIEAKLKEAHLRRQQFHEWLSTKARPKPRSPSWSSQDEDLGQRLEAKLYAAEQKRLSILAKAQRRLARLDELRQAAKTAVEMRFEKEREELGTKVELRVQQAELNRMLLRKAHRQRRAEAQEKTAKLLLQRMLHDSKYKERVRIAISQKRAAAEKKRLGLLEAEKTRARARVMQARRVAKSVCHQREIERRRLKDQLEDRLQRAKIQRAEYLRQRGNPHITSNVNWNKMHKHGDFLSRKLARCWRQFLRSRRTTFALTKAYDGLQINEKSVRSMPFEQLAGSIESPANLQMVKSLLDRLESRFTLSHASPSSSDNIDHLLRRLASPSRRGRSSSKANRSRGTNKGSNKEVKIPDSKKFSRYPSRVVLCSYMILGHPDAVFSGQGERETTLAESAAKFIREFEFLVKIILEGPLQGTTSAGSSTQLTFRSQLAAFDAAWCSYLYHFVVWKVKDARSLEDDLVKAACQLELSMMQTCKLTPNGSSGDLSLDMKSIQKQVSEDQKLLKEKVQNLSGSAGIERMECALSETRSKFFEAKENGSPLVSPVAHISSSKFDSSVPPFALVSDERISAEGRGNSSHAVHSYSKDASSSLKVGSSASGSVEGHFSSSVTEKLPSENELLVNEIVHDVRGAFTDSFDIQDKDQNDIKAKIKVTMEKAFWDGIAESMKQDKPDYGQLIHLMKEVRDELSEMAPQSWKQQILDTIDLDILSQVLKSGTHDVNYLGSILEYTLVTLQKLSAPANDDDMRMAHAKLLNELAQIDPTDDKLSASFIIAMVKGLRFVLEQIQILKKEISKARIRLMEPLIKGPAGLDYLQKAFADRYGHPSDAVSSLPQTAQWLASLVDDAEQEWNEHKDSLSALAMSHTDSLPSSQGIPPATLRTGGSVSMALNHSLPVSSPMTSKAGDDQLRECKGERIDVLLRVGLLRLACGIEGVTQETLPETLKLNFARLRDVQSQLQKVIVICTSMLVIRQILVSEKSATHPMDMDTVVSDSVKSLSMLLDSASDVGIAEIVESINWSSFSEIGGEMVGIQAKKKMLASMLAKSVRAEDPVFAKVARAVYLAVRGIVFGGSTAQGHKLAETALRRVGAALLYERVAEAAGLLVVMATVSGQVHGPWFGCLLASM
ncbi:uncharacterized protein LOC143858571 [Tasmannia lanceolata]|uniref:uncharacterized protein LOC143858571 n=1 Tax=Tasmannia lanceolata TaxID=3420 RepID=UPI00406339E4